MMRITTKITRRADGKQNIMKCHSAICGQKGDLSPKLLRRRGFAMAWVAIVFFTLFLLVGLSIDRAKLYFVSHQLHNAADAGALAGAQVVKHPDNNARQKAIDIAHANIADRVSVLVLDNPTNDPTGDVVLGRWIWQTRTFIPTDDGPNAVKVVSRRTNAHLQPSGEGGPMPLIFGALADVLTWDVAQYAIARSSGSIGAGIITLAADPDWSHAPTGLWIHGDVIVDVQGGDIQVNATQATGNSPWMAMRLQGNSTIDAREFNIVGSTNPDAEDPSAWDTYWVDPTEPASVNPFEDRIDDPLLDLNPPVIPSGVATHYGEYEYYDPDTGLLTQASEYEFTNTVTEDTIALLGETPETNPNLKVLTLDPGYYPGGITLNSTNGKVLVGYDSEPNPDPMLPPIQIPIYETYEVELRLTHGSSVEDSLYALGGGTDGRSGLVINGGSFYGEYVTVYVTGAHNGYDVEYGKLDIGGNALVEIQPPGDYFLGADGLPQINGQPGISFWQDFDNTEDAKIIGTGDFLLEGTLYFPNNHLEVGGTSFDCGNQLLVGSLDLHGNGVIGIAYDGRNFVENYCSYIVE